MTLFLRGVVVGVALTATALALRGRKPPVLAPPYCYEHKCGCPEQHPREWV